MGPAVSRRFAAADCCLTEVLVGTHLVSRGGLQPLRLRAVPNQRIERPRGLAPSLASAASSLSRAKRAHAVDAIDRGFAAGLVFGPLPQEKRCGRPTLRFFRRR